MLAHRHPRRACCARRLTSTLALAVALGIASHLAAPPRALAGTITGSKHDMTSALAKGGGLMGLVMNNYGEICVYCHTPHNANSELAGAPLWNRQAPTGPYTMYASDTVDTELPGRPSAYSLICLSCHDGTIAVDAIINQPGEGAPWHGNTETPLHFKMKMEVNACGECHNGGAVHDQSFAYIGTDLRATHPISMVYPTAAQDPKFNAPPDLGSGWGDIKLFNGKVECPSCHNPHDPDNRPFLRKSNANSALCKTCHVK
ncbi:MAG: hypothetical protein HYV63_04960 [Candidatus Schekmanbacteria bacterium]|nr:hypothetical protein [Candidatus Schekmanbacteria bacterium]